MPRAFLLLLLLASPVAGHDYWLHPDTFTPAVGKPVAVKLFVGEAFDPDEERAWQPAKTTALELVTAGGTANLLSKDRDGEKPAVNLTIPKAGTAVLRMDRGWSAITLKPEKFTAYLKEEGLDEIVKARAAAGEANADGRERYCRCLKTILQAGDTPDDTPTKPLGQALEIVPGKNPARLKAGDALPVRVLFDGKPLVGVKVTAWHRDRGNKLTADTAATDRDGGATFGLSKPGAWVVRLVYMRRCPPPAPKDTAPAADWESYWSAVTFAVGE